KNFSLPLIKDWISDSEDEAESKPKIEKKTVKSSFAKIEFVKSKEQVKSPRKTTVKQGNLNGQNTHSPRGNQRNWNNMIKNVNTAWPKAVVNASRLKAVLNAVKRNQGNPQMYLQDQGVIDNGCSRHMTGNMYYLIDFEEIDGGYVAFGGNLKGGKILGRGKARMETVPGKDYILLPLWPSNPLFSQSSKSSLNAEFKPSSDGEKKVDD
ncbi:hypothetical protein Tco_1378247, partial [Tanacetum coccineum]